MKYPLSSAQKVRDARHERAEEELREAKREQERVSAERDRALESLETFRKEESARLARESERQAHGCHGAELARAETFRLAQRSAEQKLRRALAHAISELTRAIARVAEAERALAKAAVDVGALEKHKEGWDADRRREAERAEEDEREEISSARLRDT